MTPEIPPGCHSMEERDKRSATETGKSACRASSGLLRQHRRQHRQQAMLRKGSETKLIGSVVDNKFNSAVCCLHTFLLRNLINLLNKLVASRVSCSRSIFFLFVTHQQIILHLSASYNELPTSLSDWTVLKQMPSVAPEGSKVTAHDVNTSYDCKHLDLYFLIRPQPLCHLTFSDPPPSPIPVPVLPSPLPASPFPPSVLATRSTTGSRAWPNVCTGMWGRSRTTSAQRTRSSEAVFTDFTFFSKASGTSQSWSLTVLCAI